MERTEMERRAREHGEAVVAGDQPRIIADIVEELHPVVPQLAATLPQPLEAPGWSMSRCPTTTPIR
ncbi:hypothetical protein [Gordonia terrae]